MAFVHPLRETLVSCLLDPGGAVTPRFLQSRPCGPTLEPLRARAVRAPEKRQAQEVKAVLGGFLVSTATQAGRFLRGELQAVLRSPCAQHPRDTLRITPVLEGAHEVVGRATQRCLTCAVRLHHRCTPPLQGVVEGKRGQDG